MATRAYFYAVGRRKSSRATVKLFPSGKGEMMINGKKLSDWADTLEIKYIILEPLDLLGMKKDFDCEIRTSGGGKKAQSESVRLGISRALVKKDPELRQQLKEAGYLTRDPRVKERKKPGLKRARRAPQFSKR
ncbi:30S ribosomal protein S9 [Candidatus Gracilibacteria bacterium]|nr:30S ribosomal protein S9 [Candidatus Gracilibacteria bacterium]MCF7819381.1 30S ribosomal protein S9 [Candidatus Gracilibacteria bacterium]